MIWRERGEIAGMVNLLSLSCTLAPCPAQAAHGFHCSAPFPLCLLFLSNPWVSRSCDDHFLFTVVKRFLTQEIFAKCLLKSLGSIPSLSGRCCWMFAVERYSAVICGLFPFGVLGLSRQCLKAFFSLWHSLWLCWFWVPGIFGLWFTLFPGFLISGFLNGL